MSFYYGGRADPKVEARRWWGEFQKKGERQTLIDGVSSGGSNAYQQARLLAERYPSDAPAAIEMGVRKSADEWAGPEIISALASVHTAEAKTVALRLMSSGSSLSIRLRAAGVVAHFDPVKATEAMCAEWKRLKGPKAYDREDDLAEFLIGSGRKIAVDTVGNELSRQSLDRRFGVVQAASWSNGNWMWSFPNLEPRTTSAQKRGFEKALEALLVSRLLDKEAKTGMGMSSGDVSFQDPRICDLSAYGLSKLRPKRYKYRPFASTAARDRQCIESLNRWRSEQGLVLHPLPSEPRVNKASTSVLEPLLKAASKGSAEERRASLTRVRRLGLGALPGLQQAIKSGRFADSALTDAKEVARTLSVVIREVKLVGIDSKGPLARMCLQLKGESLSSQKFGNVILSSQDWPLAILRISFSAERDDDLKGVVLTMEGTRGVPNKRIGEGWEVSTNVTLAGRNLSNMSGSGELSSLWGRDDEEGVAAAVHRALEAEPDVPFSIRFTIGPGR